MKKINLLFVLAVALVFTACKTSNATANNSPIGNSLTAKNRMNISLLDQIRQLPGMTTRNGTPFFTKNANSFAPNTNLEPLYILDDYVVGNSFRSVNQLVINVNVEKITVLSDSEASFYGSRASGGVILITTKK